MLSVEHICKSYGNNDVLNAVSFTIGEGMKAGLVGPNGVGKSTLFRIITGMERSDSGRVTTGRGETIGYLPQSMEIGGNKTIDQLIASSDDLQRMMTDLERKIDRAGEAELESLNTNYGEIARQFEERGGYEIDWKREIILEGLNLSLIDTARRVESLSGGEKTRLSLALMLLNSPDILLLDEPTNNLDFACLEWLESYLFNYKGSMIIASHDRRFLNATISRIFEIDEHTHTVTEYAGNYDDFRRIKDLERGKHEREYEEQQAEIKELTRLINTTTSPSKRKQKTRDKDKFVVNFKTERTQQLISRNVRSAKEQLDRILENPVPKPQKPMRFTVGSIDGEIRSDVVLRLENVSKQYEDKSVLNDISFLMGHDARIVISGSNGTGKTTLLRILAGEETADSGTVTYSSSAKVGYLKQEPGGENETQTVLSCYRKGRAGSEDEFIFWLVTTGLFSYDDIRKPVRQLSLGQKRKLEIARLIADEPNILLLDEPTNHISLDIIEEFESAIIDFKGPVLAISHDREFIERFAKEVWELKDGRLISIHK